MSFNIVPLNPDITNDKITLILYIHLHLGDLINSIGLVREYAKTYKVTFTTLPENLDNAKILFGDIDDISFLLTDKLFRSARKQYTAINRNFNYTIMTGDHVPGFDNSTIPLSYYTQLGYDPSIMKTNFVRKAITNPNFQELNNIPYIFVSLKAFDVLYNLNITSTYLILCTDKNYYQPGQQNYDLAQKFVNLPFFEYTEILENAVELHLIDNGLFYHAHLLNLNASKKVCYFRYFDYKFYDDTWDYVYVQDLTF